MQISDSTIHEIDELTAAKREGFARGCVDSVLGITGGEILRPVGMYGLGCMGCQVRPEQGMNRSPF